MKETKKKLCIMGTYEPTLNETPAGDDSYEMWGISALIQKIDLIKRLDRAFEFHPERYWGAYGVQKMLRDYGGPVYMQDHYDVIPNSIKYPYDEVREMFYTEAMQGKLYVTNTITWMILLGLYEGYKDFTILGVRMNSESEYGYQLPSCSWALGIIQGLSLKDKEYTISLPKETTLLRARYEYGFQEPSEWMLELKERKVRLQLGVEQTERGLLKMRDDKVRTEGALEEAKFWHDRVMGYK